jgi:hypothetical protein
MSNIILSVCVIILTAISIRLYVITEWNNRRRYLVELVIRKAKDCNETFLERCAISSKTPYKMKLDFEKPIPKEQLILWEPVITEIISSLNILNFNKRLFTWLVISEQKEIILLKQIFWEELGTGIRKELKKYSSKIHKVNIDNTEIESYLNVIDYNFRTFETISFQSK